jgi:hypothetical protein
MKKGGVVGPEKPGVRRDRKDERPARAEHSSYLAHGTSIIVDVLQHIGRDHDVKAAGWERELGAARPTQG